MSTYHERMQAQRARAAELAGADDTHALRRAVRALEEAERIVIGGGAGLSASGGLDYHDPQVLRRDFPALAALGYSTLWEALWDPGRTRLQRHAMTAAEALWARFDFPVIGAYRDLLALVEGKDYFVLTSNIDGQFQKAGFDPARIFAPQESLADLQCSVPCCREIWDGEAAYRAIAAHTDPAHFSCPGAFLPRCPRCGAPAVWNMRGRDCFLPHKVMANRAAFEAFFAACGACRAVFLELGVGFNSPGVIRHPFQRMAALWPGVTLIRVNRDHPRVPDKLRQRAVELGGDVGQTLSRMARLAASGGERRGPV